MIYPGAVYPIDIGQPLSSSQAGHNHLGGLVVGSEVTDLCSKTNYFGQIKDVLFDYAPIPRRRNRTLGRVYAGESLTYLYEDLEAAVTAFINSKTLETRPVNPPITIKKGYFVYGTPDYDFSGFIGVDSPVLTPGAAVTVPKGSGGYSQYAGNAPTTLSFKVKGISPWMGYWSNQALFQFRPKSYGVFLVNQAGDLLGLQVTFTNSMKAYNMGLATDGGDPEIIEAYTFMPIPVLSVQKGSQGLGGFEEPDYTEYTVVLPPNWDSPYSKGLGVSLNSSEGLKSYRVLQSALCLVPRTFIDTVIQ